MVVAVVLYVVWWLGSLAGLAGLALTRSPELGSDDWAAAGGLGVWSLVVAAMLVAVWRGGAISRKLLCRFGIGFGGFSVLAAIVTAPFLLLLGAMTIGTALPLMALQLVSGCALVTAGGVLARRDARQWCHRQAFSSPK